ncbi:MAG: phosphoribosylamine--glycine ligase [Candidatus Omnitrophica bacterium]|nr:phosphoribosylamine--glycine ligase [Candidatus Omnitrophota bacterium]
MKVLVIGSGGREHALVWKLAQSKLADKIFAAPGNAGISQQAECVDIKSDDIPALLDFARRQKIGLTVVGPESSLASGIVDEFQKHNLPIFGPVKKGAELEASKVFSKNLMKKYGIPTAAFLVFDNLDKAKKHLKERKMPCVVKADGLAAGKGVFVCQAVQEAEQAIDSIMKQKVFADAGKNVIIEDCLVGEEASIILFADSQEALLLASSQDHKRIDDFDRGANTGGMGAYSPAPLVTEELNQQVLRTIIYPTLTGLAAEGIIYKGILYVGIMVTAQGPKVLEFNVRFGDPETQAILPRLKSDLAETMLAVINGNLSDYKKRGGLDWDKRSCVCVVCASGGYPGAYEKGKEISGLEQAGKMADVVVFHSGTKSGNQDSKYITSAGRVLAVTGLGRDIKEAIEKTYQAVGKIKFQGMHYRKDIARKALS